MVYRDMVKRGQKLVGGDREWYMINRLKCTGDGCGRIHRQLTDSMVPYKQYSGEVVEDVVDDVVTESDPVSYPCEKTMNLWRWWYLVNHTQMEGQLRSAGYRHLDFGSEFLKSGVSLLDELKNRISPEWLMVVTRIFTNTGGRFLTVPAW